jgi:hypothetical protein
MIYTALAPCVIVLMWADPLLGEVGGGVGAGNLGFLGPKMALTYRLVQFQGAQRTLNFQCQPHVMYLPASEQLRTGPYKS